jgi:hypothetical protein
MLLKPYNRKHGKANMLINEENIVHHDWERLLQ